MQLPDVNSFSNLKTPITASPTAADGTPDPNAVVTVTSSNPTQVGVEPNGTNGWFLTTPVDTGTALITVSAGPQYEDTTFNFSYQPFVAGQLNVAIGVSVPDTP